MDGYIFERSIRLASQVDPIVVSIDPSARVNAIAIILRRRQIDDILFDRSKECQHNCYEKSILGIQNKIHETSHQFFEKEILFFPKVENVDKFDITLIFNFLKTCYK